MNLAFNRLLVLLLALLGSGLRANPAPIALRAVHFEGREYLRLTDWARASGLEVHWLKRDETLQLSGRSAKVLLTVDSREAQFNGVEVWLSFPLLAREGALYLARLDVDATFQPLLAPAKNRPGEKIRLVCLDAGHGGKDPGYCVGPNQEKKYTLLLAKEVEDQLRRAGLKVTMTRTRDTYPELPNRPEIARQRKADLFVSLHFNATETSRESVQGSQVFCLTPAGASSTNARGEGADAGWCAGNRCNPKNMLLAYQTQKALTQELSVEDHGVRRARFAVLRDAVMPAVLIEAGFMSHPVEGRKIFTSAYRRQLAHSIVSGLLAYKRSVEQEG